MPLIYTARLVHLEAVAISRGGATVLKVGDNFVSGASEKFISDPHLLHTWGHETDSCTVFVIVIMTFKCLPASNEITQQWHM